MHSATQPQVWVNIKEEPDAVVHDSTRHKSSADRSCTNTYATGRSNGNRSNSSRSSSGCGPGTINSDGHVNEAVDGAHGNRSTEEVWSGVIMLAAVLSQIYIYIFFSESIFSSYI